jgi:hypothetical protein
MTLGLVTTEDDENSCSPGGSSSHVQTQRRQAKLFSASLASRGESNSGSKCERWGGGGGGGGGGEQNAGQGTRE